MSQTRTSSAFGSLISVALTLSLLAQLSHARTDAITNGEQVAHVQLDAAFSDRQRNRYLDWVAETLDAVGRVHGDWPVDEVIIEVRAMDTSSRFVRHRDPRTVSPVPWGQIVRGDGKRPDRVVLVVNPHRSHRELLGDWTAFHELSHLLLPYRYGARWFTEGLASYYQNITQARIGRIDEREMWQKIVDGLMRGRNSTSADETALETVSESRGYGATMRVYWSGVLYWMELDVWLRSNRDTSLDLALQALKSCCSSARYRAATIAHLLDKALDTGEFSARYHQYASSRAMPEFESLLEELGIAATPDGIRLIADAPLAQIRSEIFSGTDDKSASE